jgi:hypothetical protein
VVVRVSTKIPDGSDPSVTPTAFGDLMLEWPRTSDDRNRLLRGAIRRFWQSGPRGTIQYALGRQRVEDQAAAYTRWVQKNRLTERALADLRADPRAAPYRPLISVITPVHNTESRVEACIESVRRQAGVRVPHCGRVDVRDTRAPPQQRAGIAVCVWRRSQARQRQRRFERGGSE